MLHLTRKRRTTRHIQCGTLKVDETIAYQITANNIQTKLVPFNIKMKLVSYNMKMKLKTR